MEKKFLSIAEVADVLGLSYLTVYNYVRDGKIPHVKLGRKTIIPIEWVNSLAK